MRARRVERHVNNELFTPSAPRPYTPIHHGTRGATLSHLHNATPPPQSFFYSLHPLSHAVQSQDQSLDELIKASSKDKKKGGPAGKKAGKAPGGKKGGKKGTPDGKAKLVSAVSKNSKAKRANKMAKARGMDVDMKPVKGVQPRAKTGKKGVGAKVADTLKARIAAAKGRLAGKIGGKGTPAKAADIKITIAGQKNTGGGAFAFKPMKTSSGLKAPGGGGRGRGRGRGLPAGRGLGRGRGIVKPGAGKAPGGGRNTLAGAIGKAKGKFGGRTVQVAAKAPGGRGKAPGRGGRGRGGGGRGGGRIGKAGLTLAQRFGGKKK